MNLPDNPIEILYHGMIRVHSGIRLGLDNILRQLEKSKGALQNDLPNFMNCCRTWSKGLTMHHDLEEEFLFPVLSRKMDFSGEKAAHKVVLNGLDIFKAMLDEVEADPSKFNPDRIREHLLALKGPLFKHLDDEVEHLKPEELKKAGVTASEVGDVLQRSGEAIRARRHAS